MMEPSEEVKLKLRQFAKGGLPAPEHSSLFDMLNRNPQLVAWLAQEVKGLRSPNSSTVGT